MQDTETQIKQLGRGVKQAATHLRRLTTAQKDEVLKAMASAVDSQRGQILQANAKDLAAGRDHQLSEAMLDRLHLDDQRLDKLIGDILKVVELPDPVGEVMRAWQRPNGLQISKVRVPIGVVGIIYESRPNVTSDAAVLCIKTGNGVLLRGGSEAIHSNLAIADSLRAGASACNVPPNCLTLLPMTDREAVRIMAQMDDIIDVIVPRGGKSLIEAVINSARMPVIKHYHGVCHVYVHDDADLTMASNIVENAKCQRPGVCNALETLLVNRAAADKFLPVAGRQLIDRGVEIRGDEATRQILGTAVKPATAADWTTEYLDLILSIKVVDSLDAAIDHIELYGSHHSDSIITESESTADEFLARVDSAAVYWNASTRFTDGAEFGFGAEIGISTDKLHARGPMALEELTTYKYLVRGTGQLK